MIRALITDFDGTLVDTFEANLRAYQEAFRVVGKELTSELYRECFGYRFDRFMVEMGITDSAMAKEIRECKKEVYPKFFGFLNPNRPLINLIKAFHQMGGKTAIASTARRENLMHAICHLGIADHFDLIYSADDVEKGKPSPDIYLNAMSELGVAPDEVLIFEDSPVGFEAAQASGAQYLPVEANWFKL